MDRDTSQFNKVFIKNYDEKSEVGYILEVDVKYPKELFELHGYLQFLPERKKLGKVKKLVTNLHDKSKYVIHITSLKHALKRGLISKKVYRVISFNQDELLKPYIEMNNKLRTEAKNDFEKDFFDLMNNSVFGKVMENMRRHRDVKAKLLHHNVFHQKYAYNRNEKDPIVLSILDISKTKVYGFWYDYIKPKYGDKSKLCYIDTGNFIVHIKTEVIHKDISEDVEKRFDTSNYEADRPLPTEKN